MTMKMTHALMLMLAIGAVGLTGCQRTIVEDELAVNYAADDVDAELNFWHGLADKPITSNDEALHGLILLAEGKDAAQSYDQRIQWLKQRNWIEGSFDRPADEAVTRGTVARVMCHILGIDGGLTMRVLGAHPRYATRELVYLNILPPSSEQQGMSGIQFMGMVSRAEAYKEGEL
ncbi:hypothetical protein HED60_14565 [Planctomycetales bacterium ZRK34]|nr:hypothetical protein HED60_14565 [Planctomycetales bacterium ZRK34]